LHFCQERKEAEKASKKAAKDADKAAKKAAKEAEKAAKKGGKKGSGMPLTLWLATSKPGCFLR